MADQGFLVASQAGMAQQMWESWPIGGILDAALNLLVEARREEQQEYERFLAQPSESAQRRLAILEDFHASGVPENDPGLQYLRSLLQQDFAAWQAGQTDGGFPAPQRAGLEYITESWQNLCVHVDPARTMADWARQFDGSNEVLKTPPQYYEDLIELNSRWVSHAFPWAFFSSALLAPLEEGTGAALDMTVPGPAFLGQPALTEDFLHSPWRQSGRPSSSSMYLIDKTRFLNGCQQLDHIATAYSQLISRLPEEEQSMAADFLHSLRQMAMCLQRLPELDLLLVAYSI